MVWVSLELLVMCYFFEDTTISNRCFLSYHKSGGADLTPYYLFDEDVKQFHATYRDLCRNNPEEFSYPKLKEMCDDYFYLPARAEHRGTGGIFFDDMSATDSYALPFVQSVAKAWMPSWLPIVEKRRHQSFSEQQKQWQLLRRGRYVRSCTNLLQ